MSIRKTTGLRKDAPPAKLSLKKRISLGIQGTLNAGIGTYKAIKGTLAAMGGEELAPETGGITATVVIVGSYVAVTGLGQAGTGFGQLARSFTGNGGPETTLESGATLLSGPLAASASLLSRSSVGDAERAANFESVLSGGSGLVNAPAMGSLVDAGLTAAGMASGTGCSEQPVSNGG
jgi:hypothetical protein